MYDLTPRPWMTEALCAKEENEYLIDAWHDVGNIGGSAEKVELRAELIMICQSCPVRRQCAEFAEDIERKHLGDKRTVHGIYGGETASKRIARRMKEKAE